MKNNFLKLFDYENYQKYGMLPMCTHTWLHLDVTSLNHITDCYNLNITSSHLLFLFSIYSRVYNISREGECLTAYIP